MMAGWGFQGGRKSPAKVERKGDAGLSEGIADQSSLAETKGVMGRHGAGGMEQSGVRQQRARM